MNSSGQQAKYYNKKNTFGQIRTLFDDRFHCELMRRFLPSATETGNVFLLAKDISRRVHGLNLSQMAFFKTPGKKQIKFRFHRVCKPKKNGVFWQSVLLVHHVLNPLLDLGESDGLRAVEEHADYSVQTAKHLHQNFVFKG